MAPKESTPRCLKARVAPNRRSPEQASDTLGERPETDKIVRVSKAIDSRMQTLLTGEQGTLPPANAGVVNGIVSVNPFPINCRVCKGNAGLGLVIGRVLALNTITDMQLFPRAQPRSANDYGTEFRPT